MFDSSPVLSHAAILERLKSKGLRVTPQRFAVYAHLLGRQDHPTAEQIWQDLNQNAPQSSQATVYSALQVLQEKGLIREVLLESGVCRYDANVEPHHHFRCRSCGAIIDLSWHCFPVLTWDGVPRALVPESYEVTVQGQCPGCG
jgi:Fur family peroxide stress response transcriptional regulator